MATKDTCSSARIPRQAFNAAAAAAAAAEQEEDDGGEEVCPANDADDKATVIVCLPSPNISIDTGFGALSGSAAFCLGQQQHQSAGSLAIAAATTATIIRTGANADANTTNSSNSSSLRQQLSASDVFANSKSFIKRPSTMMAGDAMSQVAQALNSTSAANRQQQSQDQQQQQSKGGVSSVLRNRRQAIVPAKVATDASQSDGEQPVGGPAEGQLVDVSDDTGSVGGGGAGGQAPIVSVFVEPAEAAGAHQSRLDSEEEATLRALRRKRSGGGAAEKSQQQQQQQQPKIVHSPSGNLQSRRFSGSQTALPTFFIEQERPSSGEADFGSSSVRRTSEFDGAQRPDSQQTNVDSIVSSESSTNLSLR